MLWIAPSEKDSGTVTLEKRLWDAADHFRANSGLKAQEYSGPILGLIFLCFAEVRFSAQRVKLEQEGVSSRRGSRVDNPDAYHADGILYLPAESRFDFLLKLPESKDIGARVNAAMRDIEAANAQLAGVLPKTYNLFTSTLLKELLKKISEIPATLDYDAFGRIYEYFLGEFAMSEGHSSLNERGRAGFVMANSASDARASEMELRRQLVEDRAVEAMVAVGPNMFYTVTFPCTLWFLSKAKSPHAGTVLFIDARHIYRQVDRAHREWTAAQISFMANIVRLYRGEPIDLTRGDGETAEKLREVFGKKPAYKDIPSLCKAATIKDIEAQLWSLNPGRYVGVAPTENVSDEDFKEQLEALNEELETLNAQARELEKTTAANVAGILEA